MHRLREAKHLLSTCEALVLAKFAEWRKYVHSWHANSLAQAYFPTVPEQVSSRGQTVMLE